MTNAGQLLVVDFDYFFPTPTMAADSTDLDLYHWDSRESPFHIGAAWYFRAAGFLARGRPLPRCNEDYARFWQRFDLSKAAEPIIAADSNGYAGCTWPSTFGAPADAWSKKRLRQVPVGGQIEITVTADDKVVTRGEGAPIPLLSRHDDEKDIAGWLAEDERANNEKRLKAIEREAAKAVPLEEILTTIENLTARLNGPQRRALAAVILQAVFGARSTSR